MAKGRRSNRQGRNGVSIQETGLRLTFLGLAFLIVPRLFGGSSMMKGVAAGLSFPGWLLLAVGALILGFAYVKKQGHLNPPSAVQGSRPDKPWTLTEAEQQQLPETLARRSTRRAATGASARFNRQPGKPSPDVNFGRTADDRTMTPPPKSNVWSPAVFAAIEWRRFEAVCEMLFGQAGFETRSQTHGADGGVDIWLYSQHAEGAAAIAQCKHWKGTPVGVKEVREFFGVMASHKLQRGTYATSSVYTADAQKFAKDNGINALDGAGLLRLIATRTPTQQQALLAVAYEGEYWIPTCASCGIKRVQRAKTKGGALFWGCRNYPDCRSMMPIATTLP